LLSFTVNGGEGGWGWRGERGLGEGRGERESGEIRRKRGKRRAVRVVREGRYNEVHL
jgi:hypothetical protein